MLERVKWIDRLFTIEKKAGSGQIAFKSRTTTVIMNQKKHRLLQKLGHNEQREFRYGL